MFDAKKARLQELKTRFEREYDQGSPDTHGVGQEYLEALVSFLDEFDHGPAANPQIVAVDTTGTINRDEEYVEWVAQEHVRVRRMLRQVN